MSRSCRGICKPWASRENRGRGPDAAAGRHNLGRACTHGAVPGEPGRDVEPDHDRASPDGSGSRSGRSRSLPTTISASPPRKPSIRPRRGDSGTRRGAEARREAEGSRTCPGLLRRRPRIPPRRPWRRWRRQRPGRSTRPGRPIGGPNRWRRPGETPWPSRNGGDGGSCW